MLTVEEALRAGMERVSPLPPGSRPLAHALGCELADGFAVRSADLEGGDHLLRIGEEITAGRVPTRPLGVREAAVIMTGAPMPPGADAVVMIEQTRRHEGGVLVDDPSVAPGRHWMPRGREMRTGDIVLRSGT